MTKLIWATVALGVALSLGLEGCGESESSRRDQLAKRFIACVPDSLTDKHRREILGLLEQFWGRAEMGEVFEEDIEEIESKLQHYIDIGRITGEELVYLMAQVGYYTYRKDPRYNLPERIVDHPTLNPDAALVVFGADSTGPRMQLYYKVPSADSTADTSAVTTPDTTADAASDTTKTPSQGGRKD
jgi:hypothetical protein